MVILVPFYAAAAAVAASSVANEWKMRVAKAVTFRE